MNSSNKLVSTNLGKIQLTITGNGPAMFFWPSLMLDGSSWQQQALHFKDKYQVILIDSPGHGKSEHLNRHFTIEECALCLSQIMDGLEISRGIVLGSSWGGIVSAVFSALYPQRTIATVIMNSSASATSLKQKFEFHFLNLLIGNSTHLPKFLINQISRIFIGKTTAQHRSKVHSQIRGYLSELNLTSVQWAIESLINSRRDIHELIGQIKSPTLVIAGKEDGTFSVPETRKMAKAIPKSLFEILDGVAHSSAIENPELVNDRIEFFLNESLKESLKTSNTNIL